MSVPRTIQPVSLADKAYQAIRELIVSLELAPGALIEEPELMERLGIGRTPVREALRRLAHERLVEVSDTVGASEVVPVDSLKFKDQKKYHERLAAALEETGETESGRQRTPLTMLLPLCAMTALGLATGIAALVPRFAAAIEAAAVRFQDQAAYASLVLNGRWTAHPVAPYPAARQFPGRERPYFFWSAFGAVALHRIKRLDRGRAGGR